MDPSACEFPPFRFARAAWGFLSPCPATKGGVRRAEAVCHGFSLRSFCVLLRSEIRPGDTRTYSTMRDRTWRTICAILLIAVTGVGLFSCFAIIVCTVVHRTQIKTHKNPVLIFHERSSSPPTEQITIFGPMGWSTREKDVFVGCLAPEIEKSRRRVRFSPIDICSENGIVDRTVNRAFGGNYDQNWFIVAQVSKPVILRQTFGKYLSVAMVEHGFGGSIPIVGHRNRKEQSVNFSRIAVATANNHRIGVEINKGLLAELERLAVDKIRIFHLFELFLVDANSRLHLMPSLDHFSPHTDGYVPVSNDCQERQKLNRKSSYIAAFCTAFAGAALALSGIVLMESGKYLWGWMLLVLVGFGIFIYGVNGIFDFIEATTELSKATNEIFAELINDSAQLPRNVVGHI
jgi:hypothetical protein